MKIILEILRETVYNVKSFAIRTVINVARRMNIILPYVMYFIGQYVYRKRWVYSAGYTVGSELFIPAIVCVMAYFVKQYANKTGRGTTVPVPEKRFTDVSEDGEVSIEHDRVQELILYVADVEDYLERKGLL